MYSVIYISEVRHPFGEGDLAALVDDAAARNAEIGVTGLLAYNGDHFMQLLEGDEQPVTERLTRIQQDERHRSVEIIRAEDRATRECADWSMTARLIPFTETGSATVCYNDWPDGFEAETRLLFTSFASMLRRQN